MLRSVHIPVRSVVILALAWINVTSDCLYAQQADAIKRPAGVKHIIDTHIHLYDTRRDGGVPWPPEDDTVLYKPHLPDEYKQVSKPAGVTGVVIVEASDRLADNRWVLDLVDDDDYFIGLVGRINPYQDDFAKQLDRLRRDPRFVGVRIHLMGKGTQISENGQLLNSLRALAASGLSADILMNGEGPETILEVAHIARQIPELRMIVNHVLGYDIDGKPPGEPWIAAVKRLAENPNVYVKISGLYQRCVIQPALKDVTHYESLLDILYNEFGSDRLIYGSNWPCTKKSGDYASFVRLVADYFEKKGPVPSERYFWQNAAKAYQLDLK